MFHKLSHYGIRYLANSWFFSYFSNKMQVVTINGFNSETQSIRYGIPQRSVSQALKRVDVVEKFLIGQIM